MEKIKIEKLIFEGYGLGYSKDGQAIFVRKSVPADIINVDIIKNKKRYAEGTISSIVQPSPKRQQPICPKFDLCGGCEHMNISYNNQLAYKETVLCEILRREKIKKAPLPIIPGSKKELFYRNSIRFFFINQNSNIGFARHNHIYNRGLVEIEGCYLQSETTNQILMLLRKVLNNQDEDKSLLWQLKIREGKFKNEFMVELITSGEQLPCKKIIVETLSSISKIKSIYHTIAPAKSLKGLRRKLIYGSAIIFEKIGKYTFQISPESFFQTNSLGVHTLYEVIKEFANIKMGEVVLDLFCGTGTIGIYLSTLSKKVVGVEIVPEAVRDAIDNAKINNIHNCDFFCADAEKYLKHNKCKFDLIIIDPPRAGLTRKTIEILSKKDSRIIYVSCNPATLARDIKIFEKYNRQLLKIQPIDMFPQTHHIECVSLIA